MKFLILPLTRRENEPTHYKAHFSCNNWNLSVPDNSKDVYDLDVIEIGNSRHTRESLFDVITCDDLVKKIKEFEYEES